VMLKMMEEYRKTGSKELLADLEKMR